MKKANDFIDISKLSFKSKTLQIGIIEEWIKAAQLDAIEVTAERCYQEMNLMSFLSSKELFTVAILRVAEQLKKELE